MPDTSFVVAPIRDHAFFEQAVFQGQVGNAFLQGSGLEAQVMHFAGGRSPGCVSGEAPLAGLHELLRPGVIQALGDPFLTARSEETTSELQSLMRITFAVDFLKKTRLWKRSNGTVWVAYIAAST